MTNIKKKPSDLLIQVRKLMPKRALTYGESLTVASVQASRLRMLLGVTEAATMPFGWVDSLPNVDLQALPAYKIEELAAELAKQTGESIGDEPPSGLTTRQKNGDYLVAINKNNSHGHRRFSLAHEIKHLFDYPYASVIHAKLGHGSKDLQRRQIERICDHFAAHLLMPKSLIKSAWAYGIQTTDALAGLFDVSEEAMYIRLSNMGFVGDEQRPAVTYFRRVASLPVTA